jgi:hypothetical protein
MLVHFTRSWKLSSNAALPVVLDVSHILGRIKGKNIVKRVSHWSALSFPWDFSPRFEGGRSIQVGTTVPEIQA